MFIIMSLWEQQPALYTSVVLSLQDTRGVTHSLVTLQFLTIEIASLRLANQRQGYTGVGLTATNQRL